MSTKAGTLNGVLADYADPNLISKEKEAWANAAAEKYRARFPEVEPDEWDLEMIRRAEEDNDDETITIEDFAKSLGIDLNSL